MKKIASLFALIISFSASSQWTYNASYDEDVGNPQSINTNGDASGIAGWTVIQGGGQGANSWSAPQILPFPFDFYGNPVTQFKASLNGLVTFDVVSAALPSANEDLPSANLPDSTICGFWDDFTVAPPTGGNDEVVTRVYGTAPNRQLWIKWYSFEMGNPLNSFSYFAIVLEETTNAIYVVDQYTGGSVPLTATVGVQLNATTALQFGTNTIAMGSNGASVSDNDYYTFMPDFLVNNNAGVAVLDSPVTPLVAGTQDVYVTVQNFGLNDLTGFDVAWEVDGVAQTSYTYSGGTILPGASSTSLVLGAHNFSNGSTTLKFWTENPNGIADAFPSNDTLEISVCTGLSGTYSIGGISPDFATLSEAVNTLNTCGVVGPVVFHVAPGTYNELLTLEEVPGGSAVNTITFDGGSASTTTITANSTGNQWATIGHDGSDYIRWKNLTVETTANTDGAVFGFWNDASHNTIDSCVILLDDITQGVSDLIGIMVSGSATNDFTEGLGNGYNTFSNNTIRGGEMGIHIEGNGIFADWTKGIVIDNNHITLMDDYGIYMDNQDSVTITNNYTAENKSANGDGIYCFDIANFDISGNEVYASDWGIYIADGNFDGPVVGQSLIANNISKSETDYGMYFDDIENIDIWHNTSWGNPGIRINDFTNLNIRNNIFRSTGDFAFEADETADAEVVDYNLYWTPAMNSLFVKDGATQYPALAVWQAGSPTLNLNSLEAEPHFVDPLNLRRMGPNGNDAAISIPAIAVDIDGEARPIGSSEDIGADEYTPISDDVEILSILPNGSECGDSTTNVYAVVVNNGTVDITSLSVGVEATGAVTASLNESSSNTLSFDETDTILVGTINTYAGGFVNFEGWVTLPGDTIQTNDTLLGSATFIPYEPVGFESYSCGTDTAVLTGSTAYPVAYQWYDAPVGGNLVGTGNSYTIPSVSTQSTYYLQYGSGSTPLLTTLAAGNSCGGGNMFDVVSASGTVLTQIAVHSDASIGSSIPVNIYYILGNTFSGNETNAALWTLEGNYNVTSGGVGNLSDYITLNNPIVLNAGQTVAIYIEYDAQYSNGNSTFTNGDVQVFTGSGLCGNFSGLNNDRMFNGELVFSVDPCSNVRTPVAAFVSPGVIVDLGTDITECGASVTLDAGNAAPQTSWEWSDLLTTTQTLDVTAPGTYSVIVTDSVGCIGMDTVNVVLSNITVNISPVLDTVCAGDTVIVDPNITGFYPYTFTWSGGETTEIIEVTTAGPNEIIVTDSIGCIVSGTSTIVFTIPPVAGFTSSLNSTELTVNTTATDADSVVYDFGDGTIVTGTDETHTYSVNDTYSVCQYVYNDCGSDTICEQVMITQVGLNELSNAIELKPNPATDQLTIRLDGFDMNSLKILTTDGRILMTSKLLNNTATLNVENLPAGVYFIRVLGNSGQGIRRFVKK